MAEHPSVICTFPGKFGDLLWALPTVRAIAETIGGPVSLQIPAGLRSIVSFLSRQPYLDRIYVDTAWQTIDTAPRQPIQPPWVLHCSDSEPIESARIYTETEAPYALVCHLGYREWPHLPLPFEVERIAQEEYADAIHRLTGKMLRATRLDPWLRPAWDLRPYARPLAIGFTDEYFELKFGITQLVSHQASARFGHPGVFVGNSPRWGTEAGPGRYAWEDAASWIAVADVFLGCCSALHVLAVGLGTPVVVMEPNPHRFHPIFWPLNGCGPRVTQVRGGDGQWTFDARHVWETILAVREAAGDRVKPGPEALVW